MGTLYISSTKKLEVYNKAIILLVSILFFPLTVSSNDNGNLYIYFKDGRVEAFPNNWITSRSISGGVLRMDINGNYFNYSTNEFDSLSYVAPTNYPYLSSWKFNNKYNDQLFVDAEASITEDSIIVATIGAIGKWLTPSFQLSSEEAVVAVNEKIIKSKKSRVNFAKDTIITVSAPGYTVLDRNKISDAVYSTPEKYLRNKVELTEDMFSTNAPTNEGEGIAMMLDNNPDTYFHPSNGDDTNADKPYFDIHLKDEVTSIQFEYSLRSNISRYPKEIQLFASKDGTEWNLKEVYTQSNGLPYKVGSTFTSPIIDLGDSYAHLRILQTKASYKNNLFFTEFGLYEIFENPDTIPVIVESEKYEYFMKPFGREYKMRINWLTDLSENVPHIDIRVEDNKFISSKDYYLNADIQINGADVYPSMNGQVQIKGRGNSSWSNNSWDKNPYRLKFAEKVKPFGLTKGKNWVLLANKIDGSMMTNALGMKIAGVVGTAGFNHIIPVELYINGFYWGSYNFTEKVGFHNNSIDLEDDTKAALLELDSYYDEDFRFHSDIYRLPVNIKEPDLTERVSLLEFSIIKDDFNAFEKALSEGEDINKWVDIDYLAKFLMVNDLICNYEINHPKSTFLYKENYFDGGKYIFGPVWDLDWAFGYEHGKDYCKTDALSDFYKSSSMECSQFIYDLRYVCEDVDKAYYKVWTDFMKNHLEEVLDYCDEYYAYARPSLEHDGNDLYWWGGGVDYQEISTRMRQWIKQRAESVYSKLTPYEIDEEDDEPSGIETLKTQEGNQLSLADVYDIRGVRVKTKVPVTELRQHLTPGLYIVNGKKMVVK